MKKLLLFGLVAGAAYLTYMQRGGIQRYMKIKQMAS
jgi:hypothetical protein